MVRTDEGNVVECRVKGNFRLKGIRTTNPVAVGDGVTIRPAAEGELAFIVAIDDRRNYIIRKASNLSKQSHILAANIDRVLLLITVARPETTTTFIDRFLASAEAYRVPSDVGVQQGGRSQRRRARHLRLSHVDLSRHWIRSVATLCASRTRCGTTGAFAHREDYPFGRALWGWQKHPHQSFDSSCWRAHCRGERSPWHGGCTPLRSANSLICLPADGLIDIPWHQKGVLVRFDMEPARNRSLFSRNLPHRQWL